MRKRILTILSFNQQESQKGVAVTGSESGQGGLRKGNHDSRSHSRLQTEPCLIMLKLTLMEDRSEIEEVDCYDPSTERFVHISGSSQLLKDFHGGEITSRTTTLMQEGAYFDDDAGSLIFPDLANVQYGDEPETNRKLAVTSTVMSSASSEPPSFSTNPSKAPSETPSFSTIPSSVPSETPSFSGNPSKNPSGAPSFSTNLSWNSTAVLRIT